MCISCNKKRKSKSSPKNSIQYISVASPSPQLTSSSSSSSSPTTASSSVSSNSNQTITSVRMAPNDTSPVHTQPSAPSPGLVLFNSEEQSDIVFLVGIDSEPIWRFPAHSFIVGNASPMFKAIVETTGERTEDNKQMNKRINWCKAETFQLILRYIYTNEITIQSVPNALVLFTAANQFLLNDLCRLCLTFLYNNCNEENVLEMLSHFSQFSYLRPSSLTQDINDLNATTGSPGLNRQSIQYSNNCDNILNELITRCYYTLDREATKLIASEAFSALEHDLIIKILSRDTLNTVSELDVFECIKRWSCHQCSRQCKELSADNKRALLGKALYTPRYLTMSLDEYKRGPYVSDLLTDEEKRPLLARLAGDSQVPLPVHLTGRKLEVRRQFVERPKVCIDELASTSNTSSNALNTMSSNAGIIAKKKSTSKKLLNGLGDLVICVIRLLD